MRIGVLALQGSVVEHMRMMRFIENARALEVRTKEDIENIDGIILPGGESTTIGKLLHEFGLFDPLKERIEGGMPVWGTCAGMILLAKEIECEKPHLGLMDIRVKRNAYGTQIDSFARKAVIPEFGEGTIDLVFIRAPWIEAVKGDVTILSTLGDHIVAARQANMLVTSFHPELTGDASVHRYFASMVGESKQNSGELCQEASL